MHVTTHGSTESIKRIMRLTNLLLVLVIIILNGSHATSDDTNIDEDGSIGRHCLKLKSRYNSIPRYVQLFGIIRNVSIQHGRHVTSRAKASLLMAGLRYRLGYRRVHMEAGQNSYCDLVKSIPQFLYNSSVYNMLVAHTSAEWAGADDDCAAFKTIQETAVGVAPRMQMIGSGGSAPVELRLHAHLTPDAWNDEKCSAAGAWPFYNNQPALQHCGFFKNLHTGGIPDELKQSNVTELNCSDKSPCVPILFVPQSGTTYTTVIRLLNYAAHANLRLRPVLFETDAKLRRHLRNHSASFLFLDYDLWARSDNTSETRVRTVQPPPCPTESCPRVLDPTSSLFVADATILAQAARILYQALIMISPRPTDLLEVLDLEATGLDPEEAACSWAYDNRERFEQWSNTTEDNLSAYILVCEDEPFDEKYKKISYRAQELVRDILNDTRQITIYLSEEIDCNDANSINRWMKTWESRLEWTRTIGVIAVGEGAAAAAASFEEAHTQIVFYDVQGVARLNDAAWTSTGRALPLACAITDFIVQQNWKRVAIISEESSLAANITSALQFTNTAITFFELKLEPPTEKKIKEVLSEMKKRDARIFFVNARASIAEKVLCEAAARGLTSEATKYAWIVREWRGQDCMKNPVQMRPFTVSYWWRGGDDNVPGIGGNKKLRDAISEELKGQTWPQMGAPLVDAILLLAHGVAASLRRYQGERYDLHGRDSPRKITKSYAEAAPALGIVQELRQHNHAQHQPLVFVHAWQENVTTLLQVMKVNEEGSIIEKRILRQAYADAAPHDGTKRCITILNGSDQFNPQCHDAAIFCFGTLLALTPLALWLARRARMKRLKRRERDIHMRLLARCERTATALSEHLVQRSALQIYEELGVGHFGHVHRGLLHLKQGRHTRLVCVAVKALREDAAAAEEAEFLREACALASLQHNHVVKLMGVCATDGPPLLLMEHAFHGDVVRYLRERRHLALINLENPQMMENDSSDTCLEATYVSPARLTRLATEAASALEYLSRERFVHRDVRAANCLIDQHRSLKLADFGLARKTDNTGAKDSDPSEDDYAYICRRHGLFPVPWMAPESVVHGVFTSMSDVWSLGVLMLEICTLGARPFGDWSAPRVLQHVKSGAHPPLPRDVDFHTHEVMEKCWRLAPDARFTAAEIKALLTASPTAIRPALRPALEPEGSPAPDSGFGERDSGHFISSDPQISTF